MGVLERPAEHDGLPEPFRTIPFEMCQHLTSFAVEVDHGPDRAILQQTARRFPCFHRLRPQAMPLDECSHEGSQPLFADGHDDCTWRRGHEPFASIENIP